MAIQRSGTSSSKGVLSTSRGEVSSVSRSMSGWRKRLKSTSPSAPASTSRLAMLPMALKYGPDLHGQRDRDRLLHRGHQIEIAGLDVAAAHVRGRWR